MSGEPIGPVKLQANAVTTAMLAEIRITADKILPLRIDADKIRASEITAEKLTCGAPTPVKLDESRIREFADADALLAWLEAPDDGTEVGS